MVSAAPFVARINMNLREDKHWSYGVVQLPPTTPGASAVRA